MVKKFIIKGKNIFLMPQSSVLSAAFVIMSLIVISQILGVVRQRILLHFFDPTEYALFLAAFRLPDLVFEVFAFGAFSSAFIPVFTKIINEDEEKKAWEVAGRVINIGLIVFIIAAVIFSLFANEFYAFVTPGFDQESVKKVASLARILFAAQGIFVVSYVMTGVLESMRRFLVPSLAPVLYNVGIIAGTLLFANRYGLYAPAIGVIMGASAHFLIQLPLAVKLGFKFSRNIRPNKEVKKIGKLALPRIFELSTLQVIKTAELALATLVGKASYTYLTLANSLQLVPISLFGVSLAKAALPTLTRQSNDKVDFKKTFLGALYQMMFFVIPLAATLVVLRIPIVRLMYGTQIFNWEATVQTGLVLSAFAIGIPAQASIALLSRAFYALHDTRTPVTLSIIDIVLTLLIEIPLILVFHLPIWSIAAANSLASYLQALVLFALLGKKLEQKSLFALKPIIKSTMAALVSGGTMFVILKFFDRSVWVKRLSFLGPFSEISSLNFERFVLDTRFTLNLTILSGFTILSGALVYVFCLYLLRSQELSIFINLIKNKAFKNKRAQLEPITTE